MPSVRDMISKKTTFNESSLSYSQGQLTPTPVPVFDPNGTPIWLSRLIGYGGQARVFVGERGGICYAVKSFNRQQVIEEGNAKHLRRELGILTHLTENYPHPYIMNLDWAFRYEKNLFLVMDLCPEDLHSRLASSRICITEGRLYTAQLLSAIEHLHSHCIMHRDIKPSNILLNSLGNLKLTDFGYAVQFNSSIPREKHITHSRVGTHGYKAPELLSEFRGPVSYSSDIYSFGIVFSQILYATMKKKSTYYSPDRIPNSRFPHFLQTFVSELTDPVPSIRPDATRAMKNIWFSTIDWHTINRSGYRNPYIPTYQKPLSRNVDLAPIPRQLKHSKRNINPTRCEDMLMGFNYVAPQHFESCVEIHASKRYNSQLKMMHRNIATPSLGTTQLVELMENNSSALVDIALSPNDSGWSACAVESPSHPPWKSTTLKRGWNWKRNNTKSTSKKYSVAADKNSKGLNHRSSLVSALCRAIISKGRVGIVDDAKL